jgi:hypothetical protein
MIDGIVEFNTAKAIACQAEKRPMFDYLSSLKCDYIVHNGELSGKTLVPGVYCTDTGIYIYLYMYIHICIYI